MPVKNFSPFIGAKSSAKGYSAVLGYVFGYTAKYDEVEEGSPSYSYYGFGTQYIEITDEWTQLGGGFEHEFCMYDVYTYKIPASLEKVTLTDVVIETELTTAWSPVTVGHLCYFVNGMLSMPGGVGGLFNIFEVDPETMTYDYEQLEKDIETYGLFTYEELNAICPLTEEMFNAAGGAYLKISIGKGNLTIDELINMINRYSKYI